MTRRDNDTDTRRVEEALDRIWPEISTPHEDEFDSIARSARAEPRPISAYRGFGLRRLRTRLAVAAGAALLVGSGLGFGLASAVTPRGTAGTHFGGLGFLPADGWTVVQSKPFGATGTGRAIAANVPLHPSDRLEDPPYLTLESLPRRGVVIELTITRRGVFTDDVAFTARGLPLEMVAARRTVTSGSSSIARRVSTYRLLAAVEAYNLEAWIYYGTKQPSADLVAAAQDQLNRLVVASEEVTISARPTIVPWGKAALTFGAIRSGKANEVVTLELKECGLKSFHGVAAARTGEGGTWQGSLMPGITTQIRAVWNGNASTPVTVWQQAGVVLDQKSRRLFQVSVAARTQFWRKRVVVQQRRSGSWRPLKSVVLTDQEGSGSFIWTSAEFRASLPRGTRLRAVFPTKQARPCLLGGVSNELRTT